MTSEILQMMTVRNIWTDEIIQFDDYEEAEWHDAYCGCPEYKDYCEIWN